MEGIGLALDLNGGRMFITDFAGSVYSATISTDPNQKTLLVAEGNLTGIAYAGFAGQAVSDNAGFSMFGYA